MQWEKNTPAPAMAPNREEAGEVSGGVLLFLRSQERGQELGAL